MSVQPHAARADRRLGCVARPAARARASRSALLACGRRRPEGHAAGTRRPGAHVLMDALSETLRVVRLVGAIFIQARFTAPWCYRSVCADTVAPILEPGAEKVVIFHLITEGECYTEIEGEPPVPLIAGDVVVFPQG